MPQCLELLGSHLETWVKFKQVYQNQITLQEESKGTQVYLHLIQIPTSKVNKLYVILKTNSKSEKNVENPQMASNEAGQMSETRSINKSQPKSTKVNSN